MTHTFAAEQYVRFNSDAAELVRRKVDVIVAVTLAAALAAQRATNTIPIVFIVVPDPVSTKLVASLAHPGGNITGLSTLAADLLAKRVEIPPVVRLEWLEDSPSQLPGAEDRSAAKLLTKDEARRIAANFAMLPKEPRHRELRRGSRF